MAYVNVLEWKAEQVAEWLQGLDDSIYPYAHYFINNNVTGRGLLNITIDDLYKLHVEKLGHQEIILEGLEHLRNLHHNLDTENLQYVCLKLSCKARSLYNELRLYGPGPNEVKQKISTASMSAAADVLDALWTLVLWLDRLPFRGQQHYEEFKATFLKIGVELATSSQRDTFAEKPVSVIKGCCEELADLSDTLIRDVNDPIILQPACLDIATAKRKTEDENFGLVFDPSAPSGVHIISEVKFQSPAHQCGRIQSGDEIVQINYQTVVGWHLKKVIQLMEENPSELILTLKKRPRHLPVFGQIYIKPFRIPARKNEKSHYFNNLPSPRAELLVAPNISFPIQKPKVVEDECDTSKVCRESESDEEEDLDEDDEKSGHLDVFGATADPTGKSPTNSMRSVLSRPRSTPQRRATISGSSPSHYKPYINITEIWNHIPKCNTGDSGSKASTLRSSDSGHHTMEESSVRDSDEILTRTPYKHQPRPQTVAASNFPSHYIDFSDPDYVSIFCQKPPQIPAPDPPGKQPPVTSTDTPGKQPPTTSSLCDSFGQQSPSMTSVCEAEYINLETDLKKQPVPKPRKQVCPEVQPSPNRKKPIPQPRKIPAESTKVTTSPATSTPSRETVTQSLKTFFPEPKKEVCPVPSSNFKSFKRFPDSASHSMLPDYVNTTPPPPPSNPPPPLESRSSLRHMLPTPNVIMRSKSQSGTSKSQAEGPQTMSPNRFGLVLDQTEARSRLSSETASLEASAPRTPYYMSDVYREGTPEKNWVESLRQVPSSPMERQFQASEAKGRKGKSYTDLGVVEEPPPVPDRLYDIPYQHRLVRTPASKKNSNS